MISDFHAHIYFNPDQIEIAKALGKAAGEKFGVRQGRYHRDPVGPHPRGSCQLTVPAHQFGDIAQWLVVSRGELTIFAHANTGDDLADHTRHVIWFGKSEELNLSIFG